MDFELSPDQAALRDAAGAVLDRYASPERVRRLVDAGIVAGTPPGPASDRGSTSGARSTEGAGSTASTPAAGDFDRPLWEAMAEQGWLAVERPADAGGLGLGMVEVSLLCEELGRRVAPSPFVGSVLALGAFGSAAEDPDLSGETREAARSWVELLATGEAVGCVAWSATPGATADITTGATADIPPGADAGSALPPPPASAPSACGRSACLLSVRPEPTVYASVADVAVVVAGDAVYEVPLAPPDRPSPEPAMDRTRSVAWLRLDRTPARRIGGAAAAAAMLDRAATALAAELLGGASRVLDMSVEYAKERIQFNRPIGSFQAVKHRLADALVDVEGMRSSVYYAAWCLASGSPDASLAASAAKAWCSDAARRVMASGLQVHGGIGFTWEHDLHLFVKRSQLDQSTFGDAVFHRERIATMLSDRRIASGDLF